jgi:hypothetical protein
MFDEIKQSVDIKNSPKFYGVENFLNKNVIIELYSKETKKSELGQGVILGAYFGFADLLTFIIRIIKGPQEHINYLCHKTTGEIAFIKGE